MRCSICGKVIKGITYWINYRPVCGDCFQRHLFQRKYGEEKYKSKPNKVSNPLEVYNEKQEYYLLTELYEEKEEFEE